MKFLAKLVLILCTLLLLFLYSVKYDRCHISLIEVFLLSIEYPTFLHSFNFNANLLRKYIESVG